MEDDAMVSMVQLSHGEHKENLGANYQVYWLHQRAAGHVLSSSRGYFRGENTQSGILMESGKNRDIEGVGLRDFHVTFIEIDLY